MDVMNDKKPDNKEEDQGTTFDMYHLFSRWDFILLVLFVLATLILTVLIVLSSQNVA
jgi:hypothetical protein